MTLTFGYSTQHEPPAPVLTVAVSVPSDLAKPTVEMSALCDSGADLTCLPADVIERLGLLEVDEVEIAGYDGRTKLRPLYAARLHCLGLGSRPATWSATAASRYEIRTA